VSISESEELSQKAFVISSFGKTFHTTGWKVGKGLDDMAFTRVNNEKIIRLCFAKKDEVLLRAAELIAAS
jgi:hypothetical protein